MNYKMSVGPRAHPDIYFPLKTLSLYIHNVINTMAGF